MRTILTIIFLTIFTTGIFAQTDSTLKGVWKLSQSKNSLGEITDVPPVFYKFFDSNNSFSNLSLRQNGLTAAHKGKYSLDSQNSKYTESVTTVNESNTQAAEATNTLKITFNEDKTSFTIEGNIQSTNGTFSLYEVWEKLD
ncbi:DUF4488 domain-containing protein [Sphingobacterium bovistauri]|uniref:DUF4488 domain-containing protein n=1 Tax=Sphingobacterium bovistauri TaxID=2781959 RepID=A0ABS7Z7Q4_9SPHI|nr:DUF4488 domain-containing protein [Sphingobacterium bovistauri]MCA5004974.1 DUF4488 domain-containing protein [Sphingobacterium bovistauri]